MIRSAISASLPAGTMYPVSPSVTTSHAPPTSVTTTGRAAAMYSRIALEKPSAFELVQKYTKNKSKLVSAFHTISEKKLIDPKLVLDSDIFVCGDDENAVNIVNSLIREIRNLRPILLGPGSLSYLAEAATPILLNAMIKNKMKNPGIKII